MKILWLGAIDTGGMCNTYKNAINMYTEHECRVFINCDTRGFDSDVVFERSMWSKPDGKTKEQKIEELKKASEWCDVIIFNAALLPGVASSYHKVVSDTYDMNWYGIDWKPYLKTKKCFAFFLGSCSLRGNYDYYIDLHKDKGMGIITCQPDIYFACSELYDRVNYVPILINNANPRYQKAPEFTEEIRAIHSPTHRAFKNTAEFERVCRRVKREHKNFDYKLIENCGFEQSIQIKQEAHIGFDQMQPDDYYCLSSVENGAMGLINIVSLGDKAQTLILDSLEMDVEPYVPWSLVSGERHLYNMLSYYAEYPKELFEQRKETYQWHHKYWNDKRLIHQLTDILEK